MGRRTYDQYCALAAALDAVGERWSLLVVRELLDGPKRYTDLLEGIPGIATDVLAARLRDLESKDLVRKRTLPPPAASTVYELTEVGEGLRPAVGAFSRWGMQLLGPREGRAFRPHWMAMGLRALFRAEAAEDVDLEAEIRLGEDRIWLRVRDGELEAGEGPASQPQVVVTSDVETLVALSQGRVTAADGVLSGRLEVEGRPQDVAALSSALGLAPVSARRGRR